jgi:hypothetical protein
MSRLKTKIFRRAAFLAPLALCLAAPLASASFTFPPMRPGLWVSSSVMHMNMAGEAPDTDNTPDVRYNCMDAATLAAAVKLMTSGGFMSGCAVDMEGTGGVYTMTIACKNPDGMTGTINGNGTFTTDGDTAMHFTDHTTSNLQNMNMTADDTGDMKWLGACPAGIVPGDYGTMKNGVFTKQGNSLTDAKTPAPQ